MSGPLGSLCLELIAFNVCVFGLRHLHYTVELTFRDYVQDQVTLHMLRYLFLITLLLSLEQVFVEV